MKDLTKLMSECMELLDELKIPYHKPANISYDNAKRRWGCCHRNINEFPVQYNITIAKTLGDDKIPDKAVKQVIIHELLHTCSGCFNHTGYWKKYADIITSKTSYIIKRTDSEQSLNINGIVREAKPKYLVSCKCCNATWTRYKTSNLTQHPEFYKCNKCGGRITSQQLY